MRGDNFCNSRYFSNRLSKQKRGVTHEIVCLFLNCFLRKLWVSPAFTLPDDRLREFWSTFLSMRKITLTLHFAHVALNQTLVLHLSA